MLRSILRKRSSLTTHLRIRNRLVQTCWHDTRLLSLRRHSQPTPIPNSSEFPDFGDYSIILPDEPFVFGTSHIKPRIVPDTIIKPLYAAKRRQTNDSDGATSYADSVHTCDAGVRIQLEGMEESLLRKVAALAKDALDYAGSLVKAGITTDTIDAAVHKFIISRSAYPSSLLYQEFPRSCCTSVNNVMVHGIPDNRPLENGDIINIDIAVYLNGFHGDTSQTFLVGDVDAQGQELVHIANRALRAGISACGPGELFRNIGGAIDNVLRDADFCVSPMFSGHQIGRDLHNPPWILHCRNDEPEIMQPGQCFTIEPCIIQGSDPTAWIFPDGWTTSTENCARSAQAEHMVLITMTGAEVLTQ